MVSKQNKKKKTTTATTKNSNMADVYIRDCTPLAVALNTAQPRGHNNKPYHPRKKNILLFRPPDQGLSLRHHVLDLFPRTS